MKTLSIFAAALMLGSFAGAQAKPADPPAAEVTKPAKLTEPEKKPVPVDAKEPLRVAIHQHDQAAKQISDINLQYVQMSAQAKAQMDVAQKKEQESAAAITKAEDEAYKTAGLDRKDFAIDDEAMQFTPRPKPQGKAEPKK